MAIQYMGEMPGDISTQGTQLTVIRQFKYFVDAGEGPLAVYNDSRVPNLGAPHPDNPNLKRGDLSLAKAEGGSTRRTYILNIPYQSPPGIESTNPGDDITEIPPWERPIFGWGQDVVDNIVPFELAYMEEAGKITDQDGKPSRPVVADSGTPLGASKNDPNLVIRFSYYLQEIDDNWSIDFHGRINENAVVVAGMPIDAKQGIIRKFTPTQLREYDSDNEIKWEYYRIDVEIEIIKNAGIRKLANTSLFFINEDLFPVRIFYNARGIGGTKGFGSKSELIDSAKADLINYPLIDQPDNYLVDIAPVDQEIPLDESGNISIDDDGKFEVYYKEFREKYPAPWEPLGLPVSRSVQDTASLGIL